MTPALFLWMRFKRNRHSTKKFISVPQTGGMVNEKRGLKILMHHEKCGGLSNMDKFLKLSKASTERGVQLYNINL